RGDGRRDQSRAEEESALQPCRVRLLRRQPPQRTHGPQPAHRRADQDQSQQRRALQGRHQAQGGSLGIAARRRRARPCTGRPRLVLNRYNTWTAGLAVAKAAAARQRWRYAAALSRWMLNIWSASVQWRSGRKPERIARRWNSTTVYLHESSVWIRSPAVNRMVRPATVTIWSARLLM